MKNLSVIIPLTILHLLFSVSFASIGETGANFLNLDVGASTIAMGGAVTAQSNGVHSLFGNPGALGWLRGTELTLMHAEHFQSIRYENLGFAHGSNALGIGLSLRGLYTSGLEERTGPSDTPLSTFGAFFFAPAVTFARSLGDHIAVGTNIKCVYGGIAEDHALSFAGDIGTTIRTSENGVHLGLTLADIGTGVRFQNTSYSLPARIMAGIGYSLFNGTLLLDGDIIQSFNEGFAYRIGSVWWLIENLGVRFGYKSGLNDNGGLSGFASGIGVRVSSIDLDYAFSSYGVLGLTHSLSLTYVFGRAARAAVDETKIAQELQKRARLTAEAFYEQGLSQQREGRYEEALKSYDIALIWFPDYSDAILRTNTVKKAMIEREISEHLARGIAEFKSYRYIEAISEFGQVLEVDSTNQQAREWIKTASDALIKVQMERIELAQEIENKIAHHLNMGLQYYSKGMYQAAIEEWNNILSYDASHKEAQEYIAKARTSIAAEIAELITQANQLIANNKWLEAANKIKRALDMQPDNVQALTKRDQIRKKLREFSSEYAKQGIELYNQGKINLAETEFKKALTYDSENTTAKNYLAKIKSHTSKVSSAELDELYMKGVTAYTQENYQLAIFYWKRVLEIKPDHKNARRNIERAQEKLKVHTK